MSAVLALLGLIVLGSMATDSFMDLLIAAGGVGLFVMDYVTWKRSEYFKGKRASVAALLISPAGAFISFASAIIIGTGLKKLCKKFYSEQHAGTCQEAVSELGGLYTGVTCATLAGFLFTFYAASEYAQYRRRHIQGDKCTAYEKTRCSYHGGRGAMEVRVGPDVDTRLVILVLSFKMKFTPVLPLVVVTFMR
ncbi:hypothetical protein BG004_003780 [Podila humilis]|nr:hypothetical protein BG004_003780 [Podila humilis]